MHVDIRENEVKWKIKIPAHINSELNPEPKPCDIISGRVWDCSSFFTYMKAQPLGAQNHLCALLI